MKKNILTTISLLVIIFSTAQNELGHQIVANDILSWFYSIGETPKP
ncbi:MAG: hypothetical protein GX296_08345 [Bacteroidales bacterium]|jgi:hypothetical protein|nr:hypothetical protein [Bacteroidales bacterium]